MINMTLKLKIRFKALFTLISINTVLLICFEAKRKLCYHVIHTKKIRGQIKEF